ncbi:MAG: hypothetical protein OES28_05870, partial [Desulfobulbaceae bacterium]|nr:hypothetical protein [Desulfobulbaceae bacterium]
APYTSMVANKPSLLIIFDGIATHILDHLFLLNEQQNEYINVFIDKRPARQYINIDNPLYVPLKRTLPYLQSLLSLPII